MASLTLTIKDAVYADALATMDGATDAERLAALKAWIRSGIRERITRTETRRLTEAANAALRDALALLDARLTD